MRHPRLISVHASSRENVFGTNFELTLAGSAGPGIDPIRSIALGQLPDPLLFAQSRLSLLHNEGFGILGSIESLSIVYGSLPPAPVPLPAAGWLLLSGCGTVLAVARRRRRDPVCSALGGS
jgi:hypothetical protein